MKEATGDLNLALVSIISIGILLAFFYTTLWPSIKNSMGLTVNCNRAVCDKEPNDDGTVNCSAYCDQNMAKDTGCTIGDPIEVPNHVPGRPTVFTCAWKG